MSIKVTLTSHRFIEYTFDKGHFMSLFPNSLIATTVELTGQEDVPIDKDFITLDIMSFIQRITQNGIIPDTIPQNMGKAADYLGMDLLLVLADPKWKDFSEFIEGNILDPQDIKTFGKEMFIFSVLNDYPLLMDYLINVGVDPTIIVMTEEYGGVDYDYNGLMLASMRGYTQIVKRLLSDPRVSPTGLTLDDVRYGEPILVAVNGGHTEIIGCLLKHSGLSQEDKEWALSAASRQGRQDIVELLLHNMKTISTERIVNPIASAAQGGQVDILNVLTDRLDPSANSNDAISCAIYGQHYDVVARLLRDPRVSSSEIRKETLDYVKCNPSMENIKVLLQEHRYL